MVLATRGTFPIRTADSCCERRYSLAVDDDRARDSEMGERMIERLVIRGRRPSGRVSLRAAEANLTEEAGVCMIAW